LHIDANLAILRGSIHKMWERLDFWLGILTTALVALAWVVSLVSRPQAALFGGSVALLGMGVAYVNYIRHGRPPIVTSYLEGPLPGSVLAVLAAGDAQNDQVIEAAISDSRGDPVVFLYLGEQQSNHTPQPFEIVNPYLNDVSAKAMLGRAEGLARKARVPHQFVYRQREDSIATTVWQILHSRDVVLSYLTAGQLRDINPDRIRYEVTPRGKVAHLLKRW
jgi:hypothetical protein